MRGGAFECRSGESHTICTILRRPAAWRCHACRPREARHLSLTPCVTGMQIQHALSVQRSFEVRNDTYNIANEGAQCTWRDKLTNRLFLPTLYRASASEKGIVVDCAVPGGLWPRARAGG